MDISQYASAFPGVTDEELMSAGFSAQEVNAYRGSASQPGFFSREAGQRRRRGLEEALAYYIPPELRAPFGLLAELNPVVSMERAGQDAQEVFSPDAALMDRLAAFGRMSSNMAAVAAPAAVAGRTAMPAAQALQEGFLGFSQGAQDVGRRVVERLNQPGSVPTMYSNPLMRAPEAAPVRAPLNLEVTRRDASNIFGEGTERVRYTDPKSGGTIEVVARPDGSASVLELEVPEGFRGQGIGQRLQERVMQDFPTMGGQVSSKAAATTAYRLGRRPPGQPNATLDEVFAMIDDMSSVNMISPSMQERIAPSAPSLPAPRNEAEAMARDILQLRAEGRADEVTEEMMAAADPQYMYFNTPLPMDYESRMARANQYFPDTAYHSTGRDFQEFVPSEFRGASFFGPTPEGAARGASASANEGVGSGSTLTMPVRVDTSRVEGLGAYGRQDMNEFRASLPDRVYTEAEVDALMASDMAPRYGNWTYFFDDLTDYDALSKFRDANPDAPIPEGIIKYRPKQPLSYGPGLRSDISGKQFAHYSEGMSERPISDYTKSIGNTGFTMMDESGLALAMTDPTRIRSRFARFDPEFRNLRNLSAGIGGAAVLTALAEDAEAGAPEMQIMGLVQQSGITGAAEALGVSPRDIEEAIAIAVPPSQWEQLVVGPR